MEPKGIAMSVWSLNTLYKVKRSYCQGLYSAEMRVGLHADTKKAYQSHVGNEFICYCKNELNVIIDKRDIIFFETYEPQRDMVKVVARFGPETTRIRLRAGSHGGGFYTLRNKYALRAGLSIHRRTTQGAWDSSLREIEHYSLAGWSEGKRCWIMEAK